jgi:hypothetical protein
LILRKHSSEQEADAYQSCSIWSRFAHGAGGSLRVRNPKLGKASSSQLFKVNVGHRFFFFSRKEAKALVLRSIKKIFKSLMKVWD